MAVISFAEDEVNWFWWSHTRSPIKTWEELKRRMFEQFQLTMEGSLGVRLLRIKQDGSYADYVKKFVAYAVLLPKLAESVLIDAFMNGLKVEIRAEVASRHPVGLKGCMKEAQLVNDRNLAQKLATDELIGVGLGGGGPWRKDTVVLQVESEKGGSVDTDHETRNDSSQRGICEEGYSNEKVIRQRILRETRQGDVFLLQ